LRAAEEGRKTSQRPATKTFRPHENKGEGRTTADLVTAGVTGRKGEREKKAMVRTSRFFMARGRERSGKRPHVGKKKGEIERCRGHRPSRGRVGKKNQKSGSMGDLGSGKVRPPVQAAGGKGAAARPDRAQKGQEKAGEVTTRGSDT